MDVVEFHKKHTSLKLIVGMLIGYTVFPILLLPMITQHSPFDLMFYYSPSTMLEHMSKMSEHDRIQYAIGLCTIDVLYPIYYCTLAAMTLAFLLQNTNLPSDIILIVYFIGIVDLLENIAIVTSLLTYPHSPMYAMYAAGLFTASKWILFSIIGAFILYLIFLRKEKTHVQEESEK